MNLIIAIRAYFRWMALWSIDYQADDWRDDLETAWEGFCRWRQGDFHENWKRAVVLAKREAAWRDLPPIFEGIEKLREAVSDIATAIGESIQALLDPLQALANAINGMTFPRAALFTHTAQHAAKQDAALDTLSWYYGIEKEEVARMVQKETSGGLWSFEQAIERVRIRLARGERK
jgi:hypothetical protein